MLLPAPVEPALVEQVWDQLGTDAGVVEVLQVLTGAFGSSLRTLPPFAVVVVSDGRTHVAVRGDLSVSLVLGGAERVDVDGSAVTTWSERVVEDVAEVLVRTGARPAPAGGVLLDPAASWPLAAGVVLADAVAWRPTVRTAGHEQPVGGATLRAPEETIAPEVTTGAVEAPAGPPHAGPASGEAPAPTRSRPSRPTRSTTTATCGARPCCAPSRTPRSGSTPRTATRPAPTPRPATNRRCRPHRPPGTTRRPGPLRSRRLRRRTRCPPPSHP
ncbi:hypothetical protein [Cellulosimicrobium sp. CUA-896]|uniref:hypothetical protein n=1 Tax=Cellulosimicrobium sp. CUA-896 TaxID=1517881 RepID=UPI00095B9678|nr:hypothetical protein [Cellulosimicrobium sp. CUA-896]OLT49391.1 hypothetical protein BJF88_02725 [Cellulosimicrobium sp. CUA-896]